MRLPLSKNKVRKNNKSHFFPYIPQDVETGKMC